MWTEALVCVGDRGARTYQSETVSRMNNESCHDDVCAHIGSVKHRLTRLMKLYAVPRLKIYISNRIWTPYFDRVLMDGCVLVCTVYRREA